MNKPFNLYKPTNNIAVDMVASCISTYRVQRRQIDRISLSPYYWRVFIEYCKMCGWDADDNAVNWDDLCMIVKGSSMQVSPLEVEFTKLAEA